MHMYRKKDCGAIQFYVAISDWNALHLDILEKYFPEKYGNDFHVLFGVDVELTFCVDDVEYGN